MTELPGIVITGASGRMGQIEQTGGSLEEHTAIMRDAQSKLRAPL